ncbi:MAG: hypothetical protein R3C61_13350 [Bacteroidia bacterium]
MAIALCDLTFGSPHSAAQLPTPENGYVPLWKISSPDPIPLAVLHYNYHFLDSLALEDNLMTVQGIQLFDVPNRPCSPFLAGTLFIAAPVREVVYTLTPSFTVRDNLYFDNSDKTLSQIRLPFHRLGTKHFSYPCARGVTP